MAFDPGPQGKATGLLFIDGLHGFWELAVLCFRSIVQNSSNLGLALTRHCPKLLILPKRQTADESNM
jgi:hypothetical protein